MYNLLELYSTMPVTKTVQRQSLTPVSNLDTGILLRPGKKSNLLNNMSILVSGASSKTPDVEQVLLTDLSGTEQQQQGNWYRIILTTASTMASTLKMEYQFFFCIFQKNSAMAT